MSKKVLSLMIATMLLLATLMGCGGGSSSDDGGNGGAATDSGSGGSSDEPIKIAVAGPMTGDYAEYGTGFKNAVQIAVDEWNAKGGVLGRTIEVVTYDDKNTGEEAANVAEKIVSDQGICAVIGHFASGVAMAAAPTYQENGIPVLSASAAHPDYSSIGDYVFRNNALIGLDMGHIVQIMYDMGKENIGILILKNDWGISAHEEFVAAMAEVEPYISMRIAHEEEFMDGTVDFGPNIAKFVDADCDVILVLGMYNIIAPFSKQYKEVNPNIDLIATASAFSVELLNLGGDAVDGLMFPTCFYYNSQEPVVRSFVDEYISRYNAPPSNLTAQAYDNANLVLKAIEMGGSADPASIKEYLYQVELDGTTGYTQFDAGGDATKTQILLKIEDGDFIEIKDAFIPQAEFVENLKNAAS